jgi:hypothetical protein
VNTIQRISRVAALLVLTFVLGTAVALAQDTLSGKYEGTVKTAAGDEKVSLELKNDAGKISGRLMKGDTAIDISEGTLTASKLLLKLGAAAKEGTINATVDGDKITGDWLAGAAKRSFELKKVAATATAPAPAAPAAFNLNGEWDAVADAQGQAFPFLLTLKIEGETVTGSSSSQLGTATIKNGTWKDGKLVFELEGQSGVISMSATVVEGKLSGDFDLAGQVQGKWVAQKKN